MLGETQISYFAWVEGCAWVCVESTKDCELTSRLLLYKISPGKQSCFDLIYLFNVALSVCFVFVGE